MNTIRFLRIDQSFLAEVVATDNWRLQMGRGNQMLKVAYCYVVGPRIQYFTLSHTFHLNTGRIVGIW